MNSSVSFAGFQPTRNHNITSPGKNHCNPSQTACLGSCSPWRWPSTPRCLRLPVQTSCTTPWPASGMRLYSRTEPSKVIKVPSLPQYSNISKSDLVPKYLNIPSCPHQVASLSSETWLPLASHHQFQGVSVASSTPAPAYSFSCDQVDIYKTSWQSFHINDQLSFPFNSLKSPQIWFGWAHSNSQIKGHLVLEVSSETQLLVFCEASAEKCHHSCRYTTTVWYPPSDTWHGAVLGRVIYPVIFPHLSS